MKYVLDTEFWERGRLYPIEIISLGIVAEDGRRWYGVNKEFNWLKVPADHWLIDNVFPHLGANPNTEKTVRQMRGELFQFLERDPSPEFWAYFADYDWVVFCQLFGTMVSLPAGWPMMALDINQYRKHLRLPRSVFPEQIAVEHHAGNDADWGMACLKILESHDSAQRAQMELTNV